MSCCGGCGGNIGSGACPGCGSCGCYCGRCGTCSSCGYSVTLDQFPETNTLAANSYLVLANDKKVSLQTLINFLGMQVSNPDIENFPDGTIPKIVSGQFQPSAMVEDADSIDSSLDIIVPGDSLKFENAVDLHNIGAQLGIESSGRESTILQYDVDSAQSYKPQWANLGAEATETVSLVDTTQIQGTKIQFELPLTGSAELVKINAMRLRSFQAVDAVRFVVSENSVPAVDGSNIVYEYPHTEKWIDGDGYSFPNGDFTIDTSPLQLYSDRTYFVTFEVTVSSGNDVSLLGDGAGLPYLRMDVQRGALEDVATASDVAGYINGPNPAISKNLALPVWDGVSGRNLLDSGFLIDDVKGDHVVHINVDSDFDQWISGGKIVIPSGTEVIIHGVRSHSLTIVIGEGSKILGLNRFNDLLNFTGTGNQFEYSGSGSFSFAEMGFICTGQQCMDFAGNGNETIVFTNCYIVTCGKVGVIDDIRTVVFRSFSVVAATDPTNGGLVIKSTNPGFCEAFNMDNSYWADGIANGVMIDFQATNMQRIQIPTGNRFNTVAGVTALQGVASSGNFTASGVGIISNNIFEGVGTYLSNITQTDKLWVLLGNSGVGDSRFQAQGYINNSALTNNFGGGLGVAELVNFGAAFIPDVTEQISIAPGGRFTCNAAEERQYYVDATIFGTIGGGATRQYDYHFAKNGVIIASSVSRAEYDGSNPGSNSVSTIVTLTDTDYIELFVTPITATTALNVETCSIKILGR